MSEDKIISALIGLVGACSSNPKTADTDALIIRALAFLLLCPEYDDKALKELTDEIYAEKNRVAPGCAVCTAPCGNTSDYDMRRIYEADDKIRDAKLRVLKKLRELAAHICRTPEFGLPRHSGFFHKALSYISYDMEEEPLLKLLEEAEQIEWDRSGKTEK